MKDLIIGYFIDEGEEENPSPGSIFVAIDEIADFNGNITCYTPIGQHGALSRDYLKDCKEITKEQYIEYSRGIYTPKEYLL